MLSRSAFAVLLQGLLFGYPILHAISLPAVGNPGSIPIQPGGSKTLPNPLDYAPDFSKDLFPPWPNVHNNDGSNITVQNWRGTKLFGWKGCGKSERDIIIEAFRDFQKLAQQKELWENIDWNAAAAKEIWGHSENDRKAVQDDRKLQIKRKALYNINKRYD
jgi:hypothetical protein